MRFVYIDEAGISAQEPVTTVAGVIIHADTQFVKTENAIRELFDEFVPNKLRPGFIFHATKLYSGTKKIDPVIWRDGARWGLLEGMMGLPKKLDLPVSVGMCRRGESIWNDRMPVERGDHAMALMLCLGLADRYLRHHTPDYEVGSMVMEDVGKNKQLLELIPKLLREKPITLEPDELYQSPEDIARGVVPDGEMAMTKIRDGIYWQSKQSAQFLQIADAWAFAWRLFLSSPSPDGARLMRAAFDGSCPPRDIFPMVHGANQFGWSASKKAI